MLVNIGEILSGNRRSVVVDTSVGLEDMNLNKENIEFVNPPIVKGKILKTEEHIVFSGNVTAKVSQPCSICNEPIIMDIDTDFEVHLIDDAEAFVMEYDTYVYENDMVDITNLIAIEVYEELPIKAVCTDDCKGLCMSCGQNLNIGNCNCGEDNKVIDIRLQKLKELLK